MCSASGMGDPSSKKKILLFGRTGCGKSTLANILYSTDPICPDHKFATSSGIRGKTIDIQREEGDRFIIVDTVGFGETDGGSVSHEEAKNTLYDFFLKTKEEGYNYIAYVHKGNKVDLFDVEIWKFFKLAFGESQSNFIVIITHRRPDDIEDYREDLQTEFDGCSRFISVDFPEVPSASEQNRSAALKRKKSMYSRNKSFKSLLEKLDEYFLPPVIPPVLRTLNKGRILLIGRYSQAKRMIQEMLVTGHASPHTRDIDSSNSEYEEAQGRGWDVVNATAFESYYRQMANRQVKVKDGAMEIVKMIFSAIRHGLYSHVVFVDELRLGMENSKMDKLVWQVLTRFLMGSHVEENLVAIIANMSGKPSVDTDFKKVNTLTAKFNRCKTILYLDLPKPSSSSTQGFPETEKSIASWKTGMQTLKRILCETGESRVGLQLSDSRDEARLLEQISQYLDPFVEGLQWLKELDPLSILSRAYKRIKDFDDSNLPELRVLRLPSRDERSDSISQPTIVGKENYSPPSSGHDETSRKQGSRGDGPSPRPPCKQWSLREGSSARATLKVSTDQLVVGYSYMTHSYLEIESPVESMNKIIVEVHSHDQGWSAGRDSNPTSYSWGELGVLDCSRSKGKVSKAIEKGRRLLVYTNRPASDEWQEHKMVVGESESKQVKEREFLSLIKKGDKVVLWLRSAYPGWATFAKSGCLEIVPWFSAD